MELQLAEEEYWKVTYEDLETIGAIIHALERTILIAEFKETMRGIKKNPTMMKLSRFVLINDKNSVLESIESVKLEKYTLEYLADAKASERENS